ncbi:MAG: M57 family metalloprotease [Ignavibacteria bacterium]|jgi:hypothetical protein
MINFTQLIHLKQLKKIVQAGFILLAAVLFTLSCTDESITNISNEESNSVVNKDHPVYQKILSMGYKETDVEEYDDYFLLQGDIRFDKEEDKLSKVTQYNTNNTVTQDHYSIKVYIDNSTFNNYSLGLAIMYAKAAYNNLNSQIFFSSTGPSSYDIRVINDTSIPGAGQSGFPNSSGEPYGTVRLNENQLPNYGVSTGDHYKLAFLLIHEIGHCIGLRHTNWKSAGEPTSSYGANHIPSTSVDDGSYGTYGSPDPNSVYNTGNFYGGTIPSFSSFSTDDETAIETLYASGQPGSVTNWLLNPNGGEYYREIEDIMTITWRTNVVTTTNVRLDLYLGPHHYMNITMSTSHSTGQYVWPIAAKITADHSPFYVKITALSDNTKTDYSDNYFSIDQR